MNVNELNHNRIETLPSLYLLGVFDGIEYVAFQNHDQQIYMKKKENFVYQLNTLDR